MKNVYRVRTAGNESENLMILVVGIETILSSFSCQFNNSGGLPSFCCAWNLGVMIKFSCESGLHGAELNVMDEEIDMIYVGPDFVTLVPVWINAVMM